MQGYHQVFEKPITTGSSEERAAGLGLNMFSEYYEADCESDIANGLCLSGEMLKDVEFKLPPFTEAGPT